MSNWDRKKQKLIEAYLDDALSAEDIKTRQLKVQREIAADAKHPLRSAEGDRLVLLERLDAVLSAIEHAAHLHESGSDETKRSLKQALFEPFDVDLVDDAGTSLAKAAYRATWEAEAALSAAARCRGALRRNAPADRIHAAGRGGQGPHA